MVEKPNKNHKNITFSTIDDPKTNANLKEIMHRTIYEKGFPNPKMRIHYTAHSLAHYGPKAAAKKGDPMPPGAEADLKFWWEISKSGPENTTTKLEFHWEVKYPFKKENERASR